MEMDVIEISFEDLMRYNVEFNESYFFFGYVIFLGTFFCILIIL